MPTKSKAVPKSSTPQVTSAAAWRSNGSAGQMITLPSGNTIRAKRTLNLPDLLAKGKIPNPLAPIMSEMLAQKKASAKIEGEGAEEAMLQMIELVNSQIPKIFLEPVVQVEPANWDEDANGEWEPDEGALRLDEIELDDRMFVFAWAQGASDDVAAFRAQRAAHVVSLADEQVLADEAKRLGGVD